MLIMLLLLFVGSRRDSGGTGEVPKGMDEVAGNETLSDDVVWTMARSKSSFSFLTVNRSNH